MSYPHDLIERYVAMWNETDPRRRQELVEQLFTHTAIRYNPAAIQHGREAIAEAVTTSYERFIARGFRFRALNNALAHHDVIKFSWEMIDAHEAVDSIGTTFLLLDPERRIRLDYQFTENSPRAGDTPRPILRPECARIPRVPGLPPDHRRGACQTESGLLLHGVEALVRLFRLLAARFPVGDDGGACYCEY